MGTNKNKARELAVGWWELDVAAKSRQRGYAICDSRPAHRIQPGEGYLCNPSRMEDRTPDLVCEACFDPAPYDPWDGGYSGLRPGPYKSFEDELEEQTTKPQHQKKWWQFWK